MLAMNSIIPAVRGGGIKENNESYNVYIWIKNMQCALFSFPKVHHYVTLFLFGYCEPCVFVPPAAIISSRASYCVSAAVFTLAVYSSERMI